MTGVYRFVPEDRYEQTWERLPMAALAAQASWPAGDRAARGAELLAELLAYARCHVPAYAQLSAPDVDERGLAAFPVVTKTDLRHADRYLASGRTPVRWNRTSGSTNAPLRTALGSEHEHNQIMRWLRHWRTFGVTGPTETRYLVPRAYRLRVFGGGALRDLAGGHLVVQQHPRGDRPAADCPVTVANPHVLRQLHPDGWAEPASVLVTSYEQRPADHQRWQAFGHGDVYGLSEVGDVAWQRIGDKHWRVHSDLVHCEILDGRRLGDLTIGELAVTDLTNRVMPVIRYRTGDVVAARCAPNGMVLELAGVSGRAVLTADTVLAGVDVMSVLLPALLDLGEPFRVAADRERVAVQVPAGAPERRLISRRLARCLPGVPITVTDDPGALAGLLEVFAPPARPASASSDPMTQDPTQDSTPSRCTTVTAGRVRVSRSGAGGRRIVCLPAGPGYGHQIARGLHPALAGLGLVDVVGYPGHGYGRSPVSVAELADELVTALGEDDVLLGHSWGARVALAVATRRRPAGLVLLNPPPDGGGGRQWTPDVERLRRLRRAEPDPERWYRRYLAEIALPPGLGTGAVTATQLLDGVPTYESAWRRLRGDRSPFDLVDALTKVTCPALVVTGVDDPFVSSAQLRRAAELPGTSVVTLPGGHYPFLDAPSALHESVRVYLAGVR